MSSFRSLNFNNGQSVNLGFITSFWGLSGYNPIETQRPTGLNVNKLKTTIQNKYSSDVPSAISVIDNTTYESFNAANTALDAVADALLNNVYWLYGDLYTGGCFMWSPSGSDTVQFVNFYGLYHVQDPIQGENYSYKCSSLNVPFRIHANNDNELPIIDNVLYFFNANDTSPDAPTNHVMDSEHQLRVVDSRSLGVYQGSDVKTQDTPLPERWEQTQWYVSIDSTSMFEVAYLGNYTDDDLTNITPHPWKRWKQNRVVPNLQFFTGTTVANGELVGGYVPIEESSAVTYPDDDPSGGDSGGPSGGDGSQDGVGDDVGLGDTPSSNFLETGISRIYLPTQAQMTAFSNYLFSTISQSAIDQLKKMWSNPLDYIENLGVCRLKGLSAYGTNNISFGGVDSGVSCNYTKTAFYDFSYSRNIAEHWNNAFDYSNYTKLKIYIPYCGIYDLNIDEFMMDSKYGGCTITVQYRIDIMSGMCIATVSSRKAQYDTHYTNLNSMLYQFNGNIFLPLSLTATDWRNTYNSVLSIAGGMIAPSPATAVGMANDIMGQKVNVQHAGSIGTNFGYMGKQKPFLIIERPSKSEPTDYKNYFGYPSNKLINMKDIPNDTYIKVSKNTMWTSKIRCTEGEMSEIKELMEGGVWK